jgi:hypothetical protein
MDTQTDERGFKKYAFEMDHNINTKFHEIWFSHSKVDREYTQHRQHGDCTSLL